MFTMKTNILNQTRCDGRIVLFINLLIPKQKWKTNPNGTRTLILSTLAWWQ